MTLISILIRYWRVAVFALLILGVISAIGYMHYQRNKIDDLSAAVELAKSEIKRKDQIIERQANQYEALQESQRQRAADQKQIEGTKHERLIADRATIAKPENKAVADIELPADMLAGVRE